MLRNPEGELIKLENELSKADRVIERLQDAEEKLELDLYNCNQHVDMLSDELDATREEKKRLEADLQFYKDALGRIKVLIDGVNYDDPIIDEIREIAI